MNDPRYPVGRFSYAAHYSAELRRTNIATIAACPAEMRRAVGGLTQAQLDTPYREGGWTARQVVHHVPDSHMNAYIRHKLAATCDQPAILTYPEAIWAELPDGKSGEVEVSLDLLDALHERWNHFLTALAPADFARTFLHPDVPTPVSLDQSVAMYAWHSRHHVAHIDSLRQRMDW